MHGYWHVDAIDTAKDFFMLSRFVVEEAGLSKLKADGPDQVMASDKLSITRYHYLQALQAGEELHAKGV